jgi:hypothetical protein
MAKNFNDTPRDEERPTSKLEDAVLDLLEDNGVGEIYCDRIIAIINEYETEQMAADAERHLGMRE